MQPSEDERAKESKSPDTAKEMTMNSFASTLYRDVTCAAAAVLITLVFSLSFVQSTSVAPGQNAHAIAAHQALRA
ncbi:MAG TPA: hypothetical protein VGD47_01900 [Steroidobacteraceae bacterium]